MAADVEAAGECSHMAVGSLVAVGMADADVFAVAALEADLFDRAVAGGKDRRAEWRGPIDAGMHFHIVQQRMAALTKAGSHDADGNRLADQKLFRALAGLVIIIVLADICRLIMVVALGFAANRQ